MYYFVYVVLNSATKKIYIGYTNRLKERVEEHNGGKSLWTRKNKKGGNWSFIYFEGYCDKLDALNREKFLKGGSGRNYLKRQLRIYLEKNMIELKSAGLRSSMVEQGTHKP